MMPTEWFRIIWPVRIVVDGEYIARLYDDAVANGDCPEGMETAHDKAMELYSAGIITLGEMK